MTDDIKPASLDAYAKWLDKSSAPAFRRIDGEGAFIAGYEAGQAAIDTAVAQERAIKAQLLEALRMLLSYTLACEQMLNAKPAGQIDIARAAIAKAGAQS